MTSPSSITGAAAKYGGTPVGRRTSSAIHDTIIHLQDEQERVQKKTFTKWVNSYLRKHSPRSEVKDLFEDMKSGVNLLYLLEMLSGQSLPTETGTKMKRVHFLSNVSTALKFLQNRKIKLVNINASDVTDGKPSIVLGLIWTIILYFQIEENTKHLGKRTRRGQQQSNAGVPPPPHLQQQLSPAAAAAAATATDAAAATNNSSDSGVGNPAQRTFQAQISMDTRGTKQALLGWAQETIANVAATTDSQCEIEVKDFGKSWRDGVAFNAMIHGLNPDLVDMAQLPSNTARVNLEQAFATAEAHLGIPRLLDPEDIDVDKPDEKSIMTYVSQFMEKYTEREMVHFTTVTQTPVEDRKRQSYENLLKWTKQMQAEQIPTVVCATKNSQQQYEAYQTFVREFETRTRKLDELRTLTQSGSAQSVSSDEWTQLQDAWNSLPAMAAQWQRQLDANLPGKLGEIVARIDHVEELMASLDAGEIFQLSKPDVIQQQIELLKDQTQLLESNRQELTQIGQEGTYMGEKLSPDQIKHLEERLQKIAARSEIARKTLLYEQAKIQLTALLSNVKSRSQHWHQKKYGGEADVQNLASDYEVFALESKFPLCVDDRVQQLTTVAKDLIESKIEDEDARQLVESELVRLNEKVAEVKSLFTAASASLADVTEAWKSYQCSMKQADNLLTSLENQFAADDAASLELNFDGVENAIEQLKLHGNSVVGLSVDSTGAEITRQMSLMDSRWRFAVEKHRELKQAELGSRKRQHQNKMKDVRAQLDRANQVLNSDIKCNVDSMTVHRESLQRIISDRSALQDQLTSAEAAIRSLEGHMPQSEIDVMTQELSAARQSLQSTMSQAENQYSAVDSCLHDVEVMFDKLSEAVKFADGCERRLKEPPDGSWSSSKIAGHLREITNFPEASSTVAALLRSIADLPGKARTHLPRLDTVDIETDIEQLGSRLETVAKQSEVQAAQLDFMNALTEFKELVAETDKSLKRPFPVASGLVDEDAHLEDSRSQRRNHVIQQMRESLHRLKTLDDRLPNSEQVDGYSGTAEHLSDVMERQLEQATATNYRLEKDAAKMEDFRRQIAEKKEQYGARLQKFEMYSREMEELKAALSGDSLTADEYKTALQRYKELSSNVRFYNSEARWLQTTKSELMEALGPSACEDDSLTRPVDETIRRVAGKVGVSPPGGDCDVTDSASSSGIADAVKCFELRQEACQQLEWITEVSSSLTHEIDDEFPIDMASLNTMFLYYQAIQAKLDSEKDKVNSSISRGEGLKKQTGASDELTSTVQSTVQALSAEWDGCTSLVQQRQRLIKDTMRDVKKLNDVQNVMALLKKQYPTTTDSAAPESAVGGSLENVKAQRDSITAHLEQLESVENDIAIIRDRLSSTTLGSRQRDELQSQVKQLETAAVELKRHMGNSLKKIETAEREWVDVEDRLGLVEHWFNGGSVEAELDDVTNRGSLSSAGLVGLNTQISQLEALSEEVSGKERELQELQTSLVALGCSGKSSSMAKVAALATSLSGIKSKLCSATNQMKVRTELLNELEQTDRWLNEESSNIKRTYVICVLDIPTTVTSLKAVVQECKSKIPLVVQLEVRIAEGFDSGRPNLRHHNQHQQLKDRCLSTRTSIEKLQLQAESRIELLLDCKDCHTSIKQIQKKVSDVEAKLSPTAQFGSVTPANLEEVDGLSQELIQLEQRCSKRAQELNSNRVTLTEADTRCRVDLRLECSSMRQRIDRIYDSLHRRRERLDRVTENSASFDGIRSNLVDCLDSINAQLENLSVPESSLYGVEQLDNLLSAIKVEIAKSGEQYDELRRVGKSLMSALANSDDPRDEEMLDRFREDLLSVADRWEQVQRRSTSIRTAVTSVMLRWRLFNEAERDVDVCLERWLEVVDGVTKSHTCGPSASADRILSTDDARKALDVYTTADGEMKRQKKLLTTLTSRATQLTSEALQLPGIDLCSVNDRCTERKAKWDSTSQAAANGRERLQKLVWQLERFEAMSSKLDQQLDNESARLRHLIHTGTSQNGMAVGVEKFQTTATLMRQSFNLLCDARRQAVELNGGNELTALADRKSESERRLNEFENMVKTLNEMANELTAEKVQLEADVRHIANELACSLETASRLKEDFSGDDGDLCSRLNEAQNLQQSLSTARNKLDTLTAARDRLAKSSADLQLVDRHLAASSRNADQTRDELRQVCSKLSRVMSDRCEAPLTDMERLLMTTEDELHKCASQSTSNGLDLEHKMETLAHLEASTNGQFDELNRSAGSKLQRFGPFLSDFTRGRLEEMRRKNEANLKHMAVKLAETKNRLNETKSRWRDFHNLYNDLVMWTNNTETQLRSFDCSVAANDDLNQRRLDELSVSLVENKKPTSDDIIRLAAVLFTMTSDSGAISSARQLAGRVEKLAAVVLELQQKLEQNLVSYEKFVKLRDRSRDWIVQYKEKINGCQQLVVDDRLKSLEILLPEKVEGNRHLAAAIKSAEALYPALAPDHRDVVRRCVRELQEDWETCVFDAEQAAVAAEKAKKQAEELDKHWYEIGTWMKELEGKLASDVEVVNSLLEKKEAMQSKKALVLEVRAYSDVVASAVEFVETLSDPTAQQKMHEIQEAFARAFERAKKQLRDTEDYYNSHLSFADSIAAWRIWLRAFNGSLSALDVSSCDRELIEQQLAKLEKLKDDKEKRMGDMISLSELAEKTAKSTGPSGVQLISTELSDVQMGWGEITWRLQKINERLVTDNTTLRNFDEAYRDIDEFFVNTDEKLGVAKELLDCTVDGLKARIEFLTSLNESVEGKRAEFDRVQSLSKQLPGGYSRRTSNVEELAVRYQRLQSDVKEKLQSAEMQLHNYEQYLEMFNSCYCLVDNLTGRLVPYGHAVNNQMELSDVQLEAEQLRALADVKERGAATVQELLDKAERLGTTLNEQSFVELRNKNSSLVSRWEQACQSLYAAQQRNSLLLVQLSTFRESLDGFYQWLDGAAETYATFDIQPSLKSKTAQLIKVKVLYQDMVSHHSMLNYMVGQLTASSLHGSNSGLDEVKEQYTRLREAVGELLTSQEDAVDKHSRLKESTKELKAEIKQITSELDKIAKITAVSDKLALQDRLQSIEDLTSRIAHVSQAFRHSAGLVAEVLDQTSVSGHDSLKDERDVIGAKIDDLNSSLETVRLAYEDALSRWEQFVRSVELAVDWIQSRETKLSQLMTVSRDKDSSMEAIQDHAVTVKILSDEVASRSAEIENFTTTSRSLLDVVDCAEVRETTGTINERYRNLSVEIKELNNRWSELIRNWKIYTEAKDRCCEQLLHVENRLDEVLTSSGLGKLALENTLNVVKQTVMTQLKLTEPMVDDVTGSATRLLTWHDNDLPIEDRKKVVSEMDEIRTTYDRLSTTAHSEVNELERKLIGWMKYEKLLMRLTAWAEDSFDEPRSLTTALNGEQEVSEYLSAKLPEDLVRLERLKVLADELNRREEQACQLQQLVTDLTTGERNTQETAGRDDDNGVETTAIAMREQASEILQAIEKRKEIIRVQCELLETSCRQHQQYADTVGRCEKWLLDTSIRLTSQSNHCSCSLEVTMHHLEEHLKLVANIQRFKGELDCAASIGRELVSSWATSSTGEPQLSEQVRQQIEKVESMYNSVTATAAHIQENLEKAAHDWITFSSLLNDCCEYLTKEVEPFADVVTRAEPINAVVQSDLKKHLATLQSYDAQLKVAQERSSKHNLVQVPHEHFHRSYSCENFQDGKLDAVPIDASTKQTSTNFEQDVVNIRSRMADVCARLLRALNEGGGSDVMLEQQQEESRMGQSKTRLANGQLGQFHSQESISALSFPLIYSVSNLHSSCLQDQDHHQPSLGSSVSETSLVFTRLPLTPGLNKSNDTAGISVRRAGGSSSALRQPPRRPVGFHQQQRWPLYGSHGNVYWPTHVDDQTDRLCEQEFADCESGYGETVRSLSTDLVAEGAACYGTNRVSPSLFDDDDVIIAVKPQEEVDRLSDCSRRKDSVDAAESSTSTDSRERQVLRAIHDADLAVRQREPGDNSRQEMSISESQHLFLPVVEGSGGGRLNGDRTITVEHPVKIVVVDNSGKSSALSGSRTVVSSEPPSIAVEQNKNTVTVTNRRKASLPVSFSDFGDLAGSSRWVDDFSSVGCSSMTRVNVVFDDDDDQPGRTDGDNTDDADDQTELSADDSLIRQLEDGTKKLVYDSAKGEVIWAEPDMETGNASGRYEIEVVEHRATRTSTVLAPNTVIDSSSSSSASEDETHDVDAVSGKQDAQERTPLNDNGISIGVNKMRKSAVPAVNAIKSSQKLAGRRTESSSHLSTASTRDLGTQTIQDGATQTDYDQSTQTEPEMNVGWSRDWNGSQSHLLGLSQQRATNLRENHLLPVDHRDDHVRYMSENEMGRYNTDRLQQQQQLHQQEQQQPMHWELQSSLPNLTQDSSSRYDFRSQFTNHKQMAGSAPWLAQSVDDRRDAIHQTPAHCSTQTPVRLRVGLDAMSLPVGFGTMPDGGDLGWQHQRDFSTQTFGQPAIGTTTDNETQTEGSGGGSSRHRRRHRHHSGQRSSGGSRNSTDSRHDHSGMHSSSSTKSHRKLKDGDRASSVTSGTNVKHGHRHHHRGKSDAEAARPDSRVSNSSCKDLLRLMLHQVRDLRDQVTSGGERTKPRATTIVDSGTRHRRLRHHQAASTERMPNRGHGRQIGVDIGLRRRPRRPHSVESYVSEREIPEWSRGAGNTEGGRGRLLRLPSSSYFNRYSSVPVSNRRATTPPPFPSYSTYFPPENSGHRQLPQPPSWMAPPTFAGATNIQPMNATDARSSPIIFIPEMPAVVPGTMATTSVPSVPAVTVPPFNVQSQVQPGSLAPATSYILVANTAPAPGNVGVAATDEKRHHRHRHHHHHRDRHHHDSDDSNHAQRRHHHHHQRQRTEGHVTSADERRARHRQEHYAGDSVRETSPDTVTSNTASGLMPSLSAAEREAKTMKQITASIRKHSPQPA